MIRAVIFDFYGVICADAYTLWQDGFYSRDNPIRRRFLDLAAANDRGEMTLDQFYRAAGRLAGQPADRVKVELDAGMKIDPRLLALIQQLRSGGYQTALLSNSPTSLYRILDKFGIRSLFKVVLCSGEVGFTKPSREIFELMLIKLGVAADEAIFIDDNPRNIVGAHKVGLTAILYTNPQSLVSALVEVGIYVGSSSQRPIQP